MNAEQNPEDFICHIPQAQPQAVKHYSQKHYPSIDFCEVKNLQVNTNQGFFAATLIVISGHSNIYEH